MPLLHACPSCGTHHRAGACACPHCGTKLASCAPRASAAAAILGLSLAGCDGGEKLIDSGVQAEYGVAFVDTDEDGYDEGNDCDDADASIHPDAKETPGDGIDSNCNEDDDT